ncbi:trimeric intracellular cation channel family protein [Wenxinia marina]|uniref:trimeric intracellular cation channel family protein n=1 Tax=Wenxinia marina TaxID=390641 RepID=UPI00037F7F2D|nr:TRIC cation channel family protein [Wenxinia marina]GGL50533.1 hypothetical protein GCM10011392_00890 [Wenxinia marina]
MEILPLAIWLDLLGTFVFAFSGALVAVRRGLDIFGIAVLAVASGLAGGMIRDMLLGATPPTALEDPRYLLTALGGKRPVWPLSVPVPGRQIVDLGDLVVRDAGEGVASRT